MAKIYTTLLLTIFLYSTNLFGQSENYKVSIASFSSSQYDEYSSIYHNDGLVFCSNQRVDLFVTYSTPDEKELFNMFYVATKGDSIGKKPLLLSSKLMTNFNDGPACFGPNDSIVIFSRNNMVSSKKRDVKDDKNKLGLFISYLKNDSWSSPEAFEHNKIDYHVTTPCLNKDGSILYFASNMLGGYGGMDLYYCNKINDSWSNPINLGPTINTDKSESFPFISDSDELFFSSNGRDGLGGLDIYSSKKLNGEWKDILHINAPINSEFDDFGLITDQNFEEGYFSTNRDNGDDIYEFSTLIPQFTDCDSILENEYCFLFYDEYYVPVDTTKTFYEWVFSDGTRIKGKEAEHCFDGPGKYMVELNINDRQTGELFLKQTQYEFELLDHVQAVISSIDEAQQKTEIHFDASKTNLPHIDIERYFWKFGDGNFAQGIDTVNMYNKRGTYTVQLGLISEKDSVGMRNKVCVEKEISIVKSLSEAGIASSQIGNSIVDKSLDGIVRDTFQLIDRLTYRAELVQLKSNLKNILRTFDVEFFQSFEKQKLFSKQTISKKTDQELDLNSNPAKNLSILSSQGTNRNSSYEMLKVEKELEVLSDQFHYSFVDTEKKLFTESANPILGRLLKILISNPMIELKIGFHVSAADSVLFNDAGSAAQSIADYLIDKGVEEYRLRTVVYGIKQNSESVVENNRKVEFVIIKE